MAETISIPIKVVNGVKWGDLSALGLAHEVCGETFKSKPDLSFAGGHRVRLYYVKKNVHWRVSTGIEVDIAAVEPATPAPIPVPKKAKGRKR
jgi:hypothetical protein